MNGTLWVFTVWRDTADSDHRHVYGFFSTDNGTNWNRISIASDEDIGYEVSGYPSAIIDANVLSNNSIIVSISDYNYWGSTSKTEWTFLCHWNNTDLSQWERVNGYSSASYSIQKCGIGLNETDKMVYTFRPFSQNNYLYYRFDPATRVKTYIGQINNKYPTDIHGRAWVFWNHTGVWNSLWAYEPGTGVVLYCYEVPAVGTGTPTLEWSGDVFSTTSWVNDLVLTHNGSYVWSVGYSTATNYYYWPYIRIRNHDETTAYFRVSENPHYGLGSLGISNLDEDYVTYTAWNYNTDRLVTFGAKTYSVLAVWQGSQSDRFDEDFDIPFNTRYISITDSPDQLYPIDPGTGNHTQLPATLGSFYAFSEWDSGNSAVDDWINYETEWVGILGWTYVPDVPDEPDDEEDGSGSEICATSWIYVAVFCLVIFGTLGLLFDLYI
jgi:hypothetical protein